MASEFPARTSSQIDSVLAGTDTTARDHAKDYLDALRTNMETTEAQFRETLVSLVLLLALFYFVTQAVVTEVNLLGFKVTDLANIQKVIPVAIAYRFYELCGQCVMRGILRSTFGAIYEKVYQPYHDKGLDDYLLGASPWLTEEIVHLERRPTFLKPAFWGFRNMWASIILGGGVLGFGYYAYIALFETPGSDWIAVASYAVSAVFFLQGLLMVIVSDTYNL